MSNSTIRDRELADRGNRKIEWVAEKMDILNQIKKERLSEKPLEGYRVSICLHLEAKTAYMARVLSELGADVVITSSNPLTCQDDVAAGLASQGVEVHSWYDASPEEYEMFLERVLEEQPDFIIDDGGDLVGKVHRDHPQLIKGIIGGAEETTTGIHRLKAMEADGSLEFPMMAVNDAYTKYLFDNRYGTGQSVWDGIMRTTNLVVAGKNVVVVGYGWCGKGVAMRARGLGGRVIVTEVDSIKASEAWMDGFQVMPIEEAAGIGDFFITVTGCKQAIDRQHLEVMKDGAILANAGHFDVEISKPGLSAISESVEQVRRNIKRYRTSDGRNLYLLAEGRLVNLAAADGHPAEIMDMSFALQVMSLLHLQENQDLKPGVYRVPESIDNRVASMKLASLGIEIDQLTPEQREYLNSWQV
ncbi:MAG: adenosylhomocysteinase [Bacillota bacterium]